MASGMLKKIYETRLGNVQFMLLQWLWGGKKEGELRKNEVIEVTPVMVRGQGGTWWATELQGFLLHGDTHKIWG